MPTITLARAGQISEPIEVGPGTRITATGGYVEWTTGTLADVRNRVAVWQTWPAGAAAATQDTLRRVVVRAIATGAMTLTWDESRQDEGPEGVYWQDVAFRVELNSGPENASGNTAALQALADLIATGGSTREVIFPDGDFYYVPPINWRGPPANEAFSMLSTPEGRWPTFRSEGATTFVSTLSRNGADWLFTNDGTPQTTHLRFEGIKWDGPGVTVRDVRGLSAGIGAAATSCTLPAGSAVSVGDAICISSDAYASMVSPAPHWATVTAVAGTNPITVTFADQPTVSNFAAATGNIVQVFRNQRAIQVGGADAANQHVFFNVAFSRCAFVDYFSAVAINDCTLQKFNQCWWNYCMFGIEFGYNIDGTEVETAQMMCQLSALSMTFASGTPTVTMSSTANLRPGMHLNDATTSVAACTPDHAVIRSVDSPTQVTMSHNAASSGTRSVVPTMGAFLAIGKSNSPFYPLQPAGVGGNGNRANADTIVVKNVFGNHIRHLVASDGATQGTLSVDGFYVELSQRVMLLGSQSGASGQQKHVFRNGKMDGIGTLTGPAFEIGNGNGAILHLDGIQSQSGARVPLVSLRNFGGPVVRWENVVWTPVGTESITAQFFWQGITPGVQEVCYFCTARPSPSGYVRAKGSVSGNVTEEIVIVDTLTMTLTGNTTLVNPPWSIVASAIGKQVRVIANQDATGGRTLTFGTQFVTAAGAAIGTTAAGTANQRLVADFAWHGGAWVLVGGSTTWIT